jgi:hypothetical protein
MTIFCLLLTKEARPPHPTPPYWISLRYGVESIDLALEDGFDIHKGGDIMEVPDYRSFISMS